MTAQADANSALRKSFAALEFLVSQATPVSLAELAVALAMPKTSVQRILGQLEDNGLVVRDATGKRYRPGGRLSYFAFDVLAASTRQSRAHSILQALVREIGESCNLGVLVDRHVVYIDRVECPWPLRTQIGVGTKAPIHCTGIGKLLLAHLPDRERDRLIDGLDLERRTPRTIVDAVTLARELDRIRKLGYSVNDQENMIGMIAIAVPVRDSAGRVVAGVALEAPVPRLALPRAKKLIPKLNRAASAIGTELTHRET